MMTMVQMKMYWPRRGRFKSEATSKKILILARLGVKFTPNLAFSTFGNKFDTQIQRRR